VHKNRSKKPEGRRQNFRAQYFYYFHC
jgi:hypothetical protein